VPGQWQGRFTTLQVIGDGKAGSSTRRFASDPKLLQQVQDVMGSVEVKLIQTIRNPYDVISVMMVRGNRSFENSINHYFTNCEILHTLRQKTTEANYISVRYEEFVMRPQHKLAQLCDFIGVEPKRDYLEDCAGIIHPKPNQSRSMVAWTPEWINFVEEKISRYEFLKGYKFDS
jgi:hypothetical protein